MKTSQPLNTDTRAVRLHTIDGYCVEFHDHGFGLGTTLTGFTLWRRWDFQSSEAQLLRHETELLTAEEFTRAVSFARAAIRQQSLTSRNYLYAKLDGLKVQSHKRGRWITLHL